MEQVGVEVFEQTYDYCELRWTGSDGSRRTRGLNRQAVDELVDTVERIYGEDSRGRRVFGSALLGELGAKLYSFLDGDERWLAQALADEPAGHMVRITGAQRLRHLPWELLAADGAPLAVRDVGPVLPVRASRDKASIKSPEVHNRPLRVLLMATSPEGVEPALAFEDEEGQILKATAKTAVELVVEESGTLEGLRFAIEAYGKGYFDVLHLSGHAIILDRQPRFVVENEVGAPVLAGADDIARALVGQWPRLVFLSGCLTGGAPEAGTMPSMSETLVTAGAPLVLGWALPVGDIAASALAAELYRQLAAGHPVDEAVVAARRALFRAKSSYWHLLRVYADTSPLAAMVTPLNTPGRKRVVVRHASQEFLDPQTRLSRVASRELFVGRRRVIQRCLRLLKTQDAEPEAIEALVLQGMGGLGKSTLASRLLERIPTHQRVVWFGRVDEVKLRELTSKIRFTSDDQQVAAIEILDNTRLDLAARLRNLLDGPLAETPCLFVFDDFEQGNLDERDGGHVLSADMAQILPALLTAIRDTNSPSRVIITSRYRFPIPTGTRIHFETLETFSGDEQTKKLANLANLRTDSKTPQAVREAAVAAASGNPRLLDWLDKLLDVDGLDVDALIAAIGGEADRFRREDILAEKLLATLPEPARIMLARLNVVELPVPEATVHAVHDHPDASAHIVRAVALGLLEAGTDPETTEPRYYVSNVLRPLLRPLLTEDDYVDACGAAAESLYEVWVTGPRQTPADT